MWVAGVLSPPSLFAPNPLDLSIPVEELAEMSSEAAECPRHSREVRPVERQGSEPPHLQPAPSWLWRCVATASPMACQWRLLFPAQQSLTQMTGFWEARRASPGKPKSAHLSIRGTQPTAQPTTHIHHLLPRCGAAPSIMSPPAARCPQPGMLTALQSSPKEGLY